MKLPDRNEQRKLVRQWRDTGRELEAIRREALRGMPYNWADVDALLELGDGYDGPPRLTSGIADMQMLYLERLRRKNAAPDAPQDTAG